MSDEPTVGDALWHLMGGGVHDLAEVIGINHGWPKSYLESVLEAGVRAVGGARPRRTPSAGGTRVTCEDVETGATQSAVIANDYVLIVDGDRYLDQTQIHPTTDTVVLTIRRRKDD